MQGASELPTLHNQQVYTVAKREIKGAWIAFACVASYIVILVVLLTIFKLQKNSYLVALIIPAVMGLVAFLLTRQASGKRLILGDEGLIYISGGYRIYTPWNNLIERVIWTRGETAIRLAEPAQPMSIAEGIAQQRPAFEKTGAGL